MPYTTEEYCKKTGGTYINKAVPGTMDVDWSYHIENSDDDINAELSKVGVITPVNTDVYITAGRRLRLMSSLKTLTAVENGIVKYSANPRAPAKTHFPFKEQYDEMIDKFKANPRELFRGQPGLTEAQIDQAFLASREPVRPNDRNLYSYTQRNGIEPEFKIGMGF